LCCSHFYFSTLIVALPDPIEKQPVYGVTLGQGEMAGYTEFYVDRLVITETKPGIKTVLPVDFY
jgi:hypothetical protein